MVMLCSCQKITGNQANLKLTVDGKNITITNGTGSTSIHHGIQLSLGADFDGNHGSFSLSVVDSTGIKVGTYPIGGVPNTRGGISIEHRSYKSDIKKYQFNYSTDTVNSGTVTITKIDDTGNLISGSFKCALGERYAYPASGTTTHSCSGSFTNL